MYTIQLNATKTHSLQVSPENLATIAHFGLFDGLAHSSGIIDETTLEKLRHLVRGLLAAPDENFSSSSSDSGDDTTDWRKALLNLCLDVLYHDKMKAYGLRQLLDLYAAQQQA